MSIDMTTIVEDTFICNDDTRNDSSISSIHDNSFVNHMRNVSGTTNELKCLENDINIRFEKTASDDIRTEMFKAMFLELQEQVGDLKHDMTFLKDEIKHKNELISFLTSQV